MVITMSALPPFTYPSLSLCSHGVIIVIYDLQIFSCLTNGNVTCVPCAVMLKTDTSGVLTTHSAIYHHLEASSVEVIVGGHKMHIFTANIPTFHSRYRRYVLITNEFHEFC
jgi:hypothetical protein